ncbi:cyclic nucleotide-binding domain-containing protein [Ornithinimicrobium sp. F0845]|uniref:cyclic nucleotide-binding domain-containing protein n=1 Tax=Ornithinimicrobium sp. F0845 TaxID=2926412 RepID=UPI001FF2FE0C|nr:cyclic nucleotide-binding domain-containing protein [Ornithinimicrobium sp. F0845]MCK0113314.1 cyclic nucleotide-binding domain-containing protein [Ornithinimicrobium sp. F0845]
MVLVHVLGRGTSLSWIPSESVSGWLKGGFDLHLSHYDKPPADFLSGVEQVEQMRADDRFRFANVISGWADFTGARPTAGWSEESGLLMGSTTVRLALGSATFLGYSLPVLREIARPDDDTFVLTQTVGGRTGVPLPRTVRHPPFVRWQAPIVWTTLTLTLRRDGTTQVELVGASAFPRHWVYDETGALTAKSGVALLQDWLDHSFGPRTPWGNQDSTALVVAAETAIERRLSGDIMAGGRRRSVRPEVRTVPEGYLLTRQGEPGEHVFLVLDGVLDVLVDDELVAEVGPGAVVGERAVLGDGLRTATVRARTRARVGRVLGTDLDSSSLHELSLGHHREDEQSEATPGE